MQKQTANCTKIEYICFPNAFLAILNASLTPMLICYRQKSVVAKIIPFHIAQIHTIFVLVFR
jgi:hypothetical protein